MIKSESGIQFNEDKFYLFDIRLRPLLKENNISDLQNLVQALKSPTASEIKDRVVDAMTINETLFFRDEKPFEYLTTEVIQGIVKNSMARNLSIWCAACSTGQEPYSLAMYLDEISYQMSGWSIEILASDISDDAVAKAKSGIYSSFEVERGVSDERKKKYFEQTEGSKWKINPKIVNMVNFSKANLLKDFSSMGPFDLILCRNVLIYFDRETKTDIVNRMCNNFKDFGFLVLGASETVTNISDKYAPIEGKGGIFKKN